jgi:hypothetical protein
MHMETELHVPELWSQIIFTDTEFAVVYCLAPISFLTTDPNKR